MKTINSLIALLFVFVISTSAKEVISWEDASKHINQVKTVEGIIVQAYNSGKVCFLNFHQDYKNNFCAVIFAKAFNAFPKNPEDYYLNKKVRITGKIIDYKGKPEIILNSQSEIEIVEVTNPVSQNSKEVISWEDAQKYIGQVVSIKGKVISAHNSGKACFLNFHRNWKKYFTIVIFGSSFKKFEQAPEVLYQNKTIIVQGLIKEYQGKPEIIVNSPTQIRIIEE